MLRTFSAVTLAFALGGSCGGCGGRSSQEPVPPGKAFRGEWSPPPREGAVVVAEVDGQRIYQEDVARQARARGLDPRAALDELIAAELLVAEARRRGLDRDPEVAEAARRERVRLLTERDFAASFDGPEDVPDAFVDAAWKKVQIRLRFNHEEYKEVLHLHLDVRDPSPETDARLRGQMDEVRTQLEALGPLDREGFTREAERLANEVGLERAKVYFYSTTKRGRAVEEFADAAFALPAKGAISPPVKSRYGWDLIYLINTLPAVHLSKDEAASLIKAEVFERFRVDAFGRWADERVAAERVVRLPGWEEWLARIEVIGARAAPAAPPGPGPARSPHDPPVAPAPPPGP